MMSDEPLAMSVPVIFIEIPTSALVNAGASFEPSPVTATTPSQICKPVTSRYLSSGEDLVDINDFKIRLKIDPSKFILLYSGNIGTKQGLENLMKC